MADAVAPRSGLVVIDATTDGRRRGACDGHVLPRTSWAVARVEGDRGLAFGALPRDAGQDEIIAALSAVSSGLVVLDRPSGGRLVGRSPDCDGCRRSNPPTILAPPRP